MKKKNYKKICLLKKKFVYLHRGSLLMLNNNISEKK
jgi:hypothetical protein